MESMPQNRNGKLQKDNKRCCNESLFPPEKKKKMQGFMSMQMLLSVNDKGTSGNIEP